MVRFNSTLWYVVDWILAYTTTTNTGLRGGDTQSSSGGSVCLLSSNQSNRSGNDPMRVNASTCKIYRSWRSICHRIDRAASVLMNQVFHLRAYAWREGKLVKRLVLKELDRMDSNGNRTRHQACTSILLVKTKSCDSHADYVSCNRPSWIKRMTIVYSKTWQ